MGLIRPARLRLTSLKYLKLVSFLKIEFQILLCKVKLDFTQNVQVSNWLIELEKRMKTLHNW